MNLLAHAYLSFNMPDILTGNMISDFIKGKKQFDYPPGIQKGIRLHREIDNFTDEHEVTGQLKQLFRAEYRLYSGAIADIVYDYFLANDKSIFTSLDDLKNFSTKTYHLLELALPQTPETFQRMFPYMKMHDWLYNYHSFTGIQKSLNGIMHRAKYITEMETAFRVFENHIPFIQDCYNEFFPLLKNHAAYTLQELLQAD